MLNRLSFFALFDDYISLINRKTGENIDLTDDGVMV